MKRTVEIPIKCGDKTCAWKKGKFCPWLRRARFGTLYYCGLFSDMTGKFGHIDLEPIELKEMNGWLQRHPLCLKLERKYPTLGGGSTRRGRRTCKGE